TMVLRGVLYHPRLGVQLHGTGVRRRKLLVRELDPRNLRREGRGRHGAEKRGAPAGGRRARGRDPGFAEGVVVLRTRRGNIGEGVLREEVVLAPGADGAGLQLRAGLAP